MDGDTTPGEIEAVTVPEVVDDKLTPVGEVQFGVGRGLRKMLETIQLGRDRARVGCQCARCWALRLSSSGGIAMA
jgi:hypothetical protein